jgi:hypothetical protein
MTDPTPLHPNKRDLKQVETLAGLGASENYICEHLRITPAQLKTHYSSALEYGKEHANLEVAETFFQLATSGEHPNITMAWMKMRAGWSDGPIATSQDDDDTEMDVAKDKLLKLLNRAANT